MSVDDTEHIRELVRREHFRADPRSDKWLGVEVAKRLKLNVNDTADVKKIQKILGIWLANNVFKKMELRDATSRKTCMFYVSVETKREGDEENVVQLFPDGEEDG